MSWMDFDGYGRRGREEQDWYDVMQVCRNGHRITAYAQSDPGARCPFCEDCGAPTIMACENCTAAIRGHHHVPGVVMIGFDQPAPRHCPDCGQPFPWHQAALDNLVEVLREGGVSDSDLEWVRNALPDVTKDTPRSEGAALKLRRILGQLDEPFASVAMQAAGSVLGASARRSRRRRSCGLVNRLIVRSSFTTFSPLPTVRLATASDALCT